MRLSPQPSLEQREREKSRPTTRVAPAGPYRNNRLPILLALVILLFIALTTSQTIAPASAQSGGGYDLTWNSIDGGGGMFSMGGPYSLGGTIGQPDAGMMSGGSYTLNGGFWVDFSGNRLYLPIIEK